MKIEKLSAIKNLEFIITGTLKMTSIQYFLRPRNCTLNSRLREFQFKLLYELLYNTYVDH